MECDCLSYFSSKLEKCPCGDNCPGLRRQFKKLFFCILCVEMDVLVTAVGIAGNVNLQKSVQKKIEMMKKRSDFLALIL